MTPNPGLVPPVQLLSLFTISDAFLGPPGPFLSLKILWTLLSPRSLSNLFLGLSRTISELFWGFSQTSSQLSSPPNPKALTSIRGIARNIIYLRGEPTTNKYENPKPDQGHKLGGWVGKGHEPWRTPQHTPCVVVCAEHVTHPKTLNPNPVSGLSGLGAACTCFVALVVMASTYSTGKRPKP